MISTLEQTTTPLRAVLEEWTRVVGADAILDAQQATEKFSPSTTGVKRRIAGAVAPRSQEQVAEIARIAAQRGVKLHPISTGRNWGYGAANPVHDNNFVLDLSGMNRILEFDEELGLVTVEPGVTQRQLSDYLIERDLPFMVPVHGGGPDCSLLGNAMQRGYGITPYADHFGALTTLQAVLTDGSIYKPTLTAMGCPRIDKAFKWGLGPYMDGMFTQGNLGIVTQATFALAMRPACVRAFVFQIKREEDLEPAVAAVQRILRSLGSAVSSINLMNDVRVLSMTTEFPADVLASGGTLTEEHLRPLRKQHDVTHWTGVGALYVDAPMLRGAKRIIRQALRDVASVHFMGERELRWGDRLTRLLPAVPVKARLRKRLEQMSTFLKMMNGVPQSLALPLAYWKSGQRPPAGQAMNPARDGCGLMWYSPLVPMTPIDCRCYVDMVRETCLAHTIDPLITLTSVSDRCFDSTVPLLFDRQSSSKTAQAETCYNALFSNGRELGFLPYRVSVKQMDVALDVMANVVPLRSKTLY